MALIAFPRARRALRGLRDTTAKLRPTAAPESVPAAPIPAQPQIAWPRTPRPRKWLLLYSCHFLGLANCLHLLSDEIEVEAHQPHDLLRGGAKSPSNGRPQPVWKRPLEQYEHILVLPCLLRQLQPLGLGERENVVRLPALVFDGFHPDFCYLQYCSASPDDGKSRRAPLVPGTQSLIAAVAFQAGLSVDQTLALYNEDIYERLGYFDRWGPARDHLLESFAEAGLDIRASFLAWSRQGAFMHTKFHPHIHCLRDLALILLERLEVPIAPCPFLPPDNLVQAQVDPVYPELGRRLGVLGGYRFKPGNSYRTVDLRTYLEGRFALYRAGGPFELALTNRHLQSTVDSLREIIA